MSDGKIVRTGPLTNVKNVSVLKYSRDGKFIAIGQLDGGIEVLTAENFKTHRKYEGKCGSRHEKSIFNLQFTQ